VIYLLRSPIGILVFTALAVATDAGLAGLTTNGGSHGLTAILCAYAHNTRTNGQIFAGQRTAPTDRAES